MSQHPMQPVELDENDVLCFKTNHIVKYLFNVCKLHGICDFDKLGIMPFTDEDWQQFEQLLGYSLSQFATSGYATDGAVYQANVLGKEVLALKRAREDG